jgi:hypothetical protein
MEPESVGAILPRVLEQIKQRILEQPFTAERSIQVDQIDEILNTPPSSPPPADLMEMVERKRGRR